jgi:hypothetical protein
MENSIKNTLSAPPKPSAMESVFYCAHSFETVMAYDMPLPPAEYIHRDSQYYIETQT